MYNSKLKVATTLNVADYDNNVEELEQLGATVVDAKWLEWDSIAIEDRTLQTRVRDIEIAHVANLAASIKSSRLKVLPIVVWNEDKNKYVVANGHHRLYALNQIQTEEGYEGPNLYPVIIVEFKNTIDRLDAITRLNVHDPAKNQSQEDAVLYLQNLDKEGYFTGYKKNIKRWKHRAYAKLDVNFPLIKTCAKDNVFEKAFKLTAKRFKAWTKAGVNDEMKKIYGSLNGGVTPKSGDVSGDVCFVSSTYDAARKAVYVAATQRAHLLNSKSATNPLDIKVTTYFNKVKDSKSLKMFRLNALRDMAVMNNMVWSKSNVATVTEVTFLLQCIEGKNKETKNIKYKWNGKTFSKVQ